MTYLHARRSAWLTSAAFLLTGATGAWAQATGSTPADGGSTSSSQVTPANVNAGGLQDIVVTAEKRATNNQRTPASIGVVSGDDLRQQGAHTAAQVFKDISGIEQAAGGGQGSNFTIRGVGGGGLFAQDASVTTSVNGVFNQRGNSIRGNYYDVARVEVARGPQSTLTGRSAEGGSISIISNEPKLNVLEGYATAEAGNYALLSAEGAINLPMGEKFAIRAAFVGTKHDGYFSDGTSDDDTFSGRVRLLAQPTENFKLLLTGEATNQGGRPENGDQTGVFNLSGPPVFLYGKYGTPSPGGTQQYKVYNIYADMTWNMGFASLYFQPTWTKNTLQFNNYTLTPLTYLNNYNAQIANNVATGTAATNAYNSAIMQQKQFSPQYQHTFELRLTSPSGHPFEWLTGAYYYWNKQAIATQVANGALASTTAAGVTTYTSSFPNAVDPKIYPESPIRYETNLDFYGQASYRFPSETKITVGGRYSRVKKTRGASAGNYIEPDGVAINTNYFVLLDNGINGTTTNSPTYLRYYNLPAASQVFTRFNWKVSVEQQLAPRSMVYAMVSTGWKAGSLTGSNLPSATDTCTNCTTPGPYLNSNFSLFYKPEYLTSYEIGTKNTFMNNRLRLNLTAFYYNYRNYQFNYTANPYNTATGIDPDLTATLTQNAKKAVNYGAELETAFLATPNDRFNLSVSYLSAKLKSVQVTTANVYIQQWAAALQNQTLPQSPKWQIKGGYSHVFRIADGMTLTPEVDGSFETRKLINTIPGAYTSTGAANVGGAYLLTRTDLYTQPAYAKMNGSLTLTSANGAYSITGYIRNAFNKVTYHSFILPTAFFNANGTSAVGNIQYFPDDPRTFGVIVNAKF